MTTAAADPSPEGYLSQVARDERAVWLTVAAIALLGLVLRLFAASGDLWLDEIWSLELVGGLTSVDQVFWRINHDNNHFLNSAYLYLVGPDASPLVHRAPAIVFGVASIVVAAAVTANRGRTTQVLASALIAISHPLVHYGSEARGYSGLVLFSLLAVLCLERLFDRRGSALLLAAVVLLGFLSHVTMIETVLVLVAWSLWVTFRRGDGPVRAALDTTKIFLPAFAAVLPLALCIAYGAWAFGFKLGGSTPFSLEAAVAGYGGMIRYMFGLPAWLPNWFLTLAAAALVCVSAWKWPGRRASLYVIGIVGLPILMVQLRLPNLEFPRYFLVSGVLLLLWASELLGRGFDAAGWRRWASAAALAAIVLGNALSLSKSYEAGRGSYAAIVDRITRDGSGAYASNSEFRTPKIVNFFAGRLNRQARLVPSEEVCAVRPDWLISEIKAAPPATEERVDGCGLVYERVETTKNWGLSGIAWALYRKRESVGQNRQVLSAFEAFRLTPVMRQTPSG